MSCNFSTLLLLSSGCIVGCGKLSQFASVWHLASAGRVIFEGKWCHPIQSSESFWVLEQKTFVLLTLEKKRELWWDCLLQGDPTIDTTKVCLFAASHLRLLIHPC